MANTYEIRLIRVLDYIHDTPAGDLSLDALADVAALSRFHFHRVFHAMLGETAAQSVRRMRMHRACLPWYKATRPWQKLPAPWAIQTLHLLPAVLPKAMARRPLTFAQRANCAPTFQPSDLENR